MKTLQEKFSQLIAAHTATKKNLWGNNAPVPPDSNLTSEIVNLILMEAIQARTSDIHIEPFQDQLRIRFRIDGKLYDVLRIENHANITVIPRIKILANMPVDAMSGRKAMDGRFSTILGQQEFDFRVATFPALMGEKVAIRILNKDLSSVNLRTIGLNPQDHARLEQIIQRKSGLLIVSGPTGSGKTSTLYSILRQLHTPHVNIVTLEDPVEYQIDGMNQCDINKKGGDESFASGLKALLRQDPNIVLIGEIRDSETAEIAIRASITGHLVLTSLHANNALGTVIRLVNMGLERYVVSYAVIGAIAQRLVPKLCESCRIPYKMSPEALNKLCSQFGIPPDIFSSKKRPGSESGLQYLSGPEENIVTQELTFFKSAGCPACNGTGYYGRMGIFEVVVFTDGLRDAIIRNAPVQELETIAQKSGFRPLTLDAIEKAKQGYVTLEDIHSILLEKTV